MDFPAFLLANETSRKQFWLAAFASTLARLPATEALAEADLALKLSDERWRSAPVIGTFQFQHNYPVGFDYITNDGAGGPSADASA